MPGRCAAGLAPTAQPHIAVVFGEDRALMASLMPGHVERPDSFDAPMPQGTSGLWRRTIAL